VRVCNGLPDDSRTELDFTKNVQDIDKHNIVIAMNDLQILKM
jgi:hypothetical protein